MRNFLKFSKLLGRSPALVQGAGGNTSVKIGNNLFVKASGNFLKDTGENRGYVCCKLAPVKKYLLGLKKYHTNLELPFNALVEKNLDPKKSFGPPRVDSDKTITPQVEAGKPSIETGLHSIIPSKYVFHTHSALANVLNFADGGKKIIQDLFPAALIISYKNPGLELAYALSKQTKLPNIIFLQSHGLITHHNKAQTAYNLTLAVQNKIIKYLKKQKVYKPFAVSKKSASLKKHMFPDSVVYSQIDFKNLAPKKKQVYYEICSMINYTQEAIKQLSMRPMFLSQSRVNFLINMEQEKHRIKLFKNL